MRFIVSLFVLLAFSAPSFASENKDVQKPALVKGSKPYQVRYTRDTISPSSIEPAAGVEMEVVKSSNHPAENAQTGEDMSSQKMMKLHGKK